MSFPLISRATNPPPVAARPLIRRGLEFHLGSSLVNSQGLRSAWGDWLIEHPWQTFWTITSDKRTHPEAILKRWRYLSATVSRDLYGRRWAARQAGLRWVVGLERHKSGNPHLHALAYAPGCNLDDVATFSRREWQDYATFTGGWSKVEKPRSQSDTVA